MKAVLALLCLLLAGCTDWVLVREPWTPEERAAVAAHEKELLDAIRVRSLAGHDQDWDDTIIAAHQVAIETCCPARLVEINVHGRTGRWKKVVP